MFIQFSLRHSIVSLKEECQLTGNDPKLKFPNVSHNFQSDNNQSHIGQKVKGVEIKGVGSRNKVPEEECSSILFSLK